MGRPGTLSLEPIELPDDASSLPPFLATARALVADFEASFSSCGAPAVPSSSHGWKTDRHGRRSAGEVTVKTARGRATGPGVRDLLGPDELWIGRVSEHGPEQGTWNDWQNLLKDKEGGNEWIPELRGLEILSPYAIPACLASELHSAAAVWISRLALPMPLQDRTFLCLVLTSATEDEFWNVSVPFQDSAYPPGQGEEHGRTRGAYVSVERVRRLPSGRTEWIVLTSFSLGGNVIPQLAVNVKMAGKLVDDVGNFLRWVQKNRTGCDVRRPGAVSASR